MFDNQDYSAKQVDQQIYNNGSGIKIASHTTYGHYYFATMCFATYLDAGSVISAKVRAYGANVKDDGYDDLEITKIK